MNNIVTLSYGDCNIEPKCKGCYIETLKEQVTPLDRNPKHLLENGKGAKLFFQINNKEDIKKSIERINSNDKFGMVDADIIFIIPLDIFINNHKMVEEIKNKYRIAITVNTFMKSHIDIMNSNKIHNIKIRYLAMEITFSTESVKNYINDGAIKKAMLHFLKLASANSDLNVAGGILNYLRTDDSITKQDLWKLMYDMSMAAEFPIELSSCLSFAFGLSDTMPCERNNLYEFIDNSLYKEGCPYPNKSCEVI